MNVISQILGIFSAVFVIAMGIGALTVAVMYVVDITQTRHAIRRNFPVVGRFRYAFETMGLRQCPVSRTGRGAPADGIERSSLQKERRID